MEHVRRALAEREEAEHVYQEELQRVASKQVCPSLPPRARTRLCCCVASAGGQDVADACKTDQNGKY